MDYQPLDVKATCSNLKATASFYSQKLGFNVVKQTDKTIDLSFEKNKLTFALGPIRKQTFVLPIDDAQAEYDRVIQQKIKLDSPMNVRDEETETFNKVFEEFSILDPDGHRLTFMTFVRFRC